MKSPIDDYVDSVRKRLGWRILFERRALREMRDHLEELAHSLRHTSGDNYLHQLMATERFGSVDATVQAINESNRGLRLVDRLRRQPTMVALLLLSPALFLMSIAVLTYNADLTVLQGLAEPLDLLDWKFIWVRLLVTILLPLIAMGVVCKSSIHVERDDGPTGPRMHVVIDAPIRFLGRMGIVFSVLVAVLIYY